MQICNQCGARSENAFDCIWTVWHTGTMWQFRVAKCKLLHRAYLSNKILPQKCMNIWLLFCAFLVFIYILDTKHFKWEDRSEFFYILVNFNMYALLDGRSSRQKSFKKLSVHTWAHWIAHCKMVYFQFLIKLSVFKARVVFKSVFIAMNIIPIVESFSSSCSSLPTPMQKYNYFVLAMFHVWHLDGRQGQISGCKI